MDNLSPQLRLRLRLQQASNALQATWIWYTALVRNWWKKTLARIRIARTRGHYNVRKWKIDTARRVRPTHGEFTDDEIKLLGSLVEHSGWTVFQKYLALERDAQVNYALVNAKDLVEFGNAQGSVSTYNKIESDMRNFNLNAQELIQATTIKVKTETLEKQFDEEYHEDTL